MFLPNRTVGSKLQKLQDVEQMLAKLESARRDTYIKKLNKTRKKMEEQRSGALKGVEELAVTLRKANCKKEAGELKRIVEEAKNAKGSNEILRVAKEASDLAEVMRRLRWRTPVYISVCTSTMGRTRP